MASPTSKIDSVGDWQGQVIAHDDLVSRLAAQWEEIGKPEMPRNAGERRSASKRALLEALNQLGADW